MEIVNDMLNNAVPDPNADPTLAPPRNTGGPATPPPAATTGGNMTPPAQVPPTPKPPVTPPVTTPGARPAPGADYWEKHNAAGAAVQTGLNANKMPSGWWNQSGKGLTNDPNGVSGNWSGPIPVQNLTTDDTAFLAAFARTGAVNGFDPRMIASGDHNSVSAALGTDTMRGLHAAQSDTANFYANRVSPAVKQAMEQMVAANPQLASAYQSFIGRSDGSGHGALSEADAQAKQAAANTRSQQMSADATAAAAARPGVVSSNDPANYTTFNRNADGSVSPYVAPAAGTAPPAQPGDVTNADGSVTHSDGTTTLPPRAGGTTGPVTDNRDGRGTPAGTTTTPPVTPGPPGAGTTTTPPTTTSVGGTGTTPPGGTDTTTSGGTGIVNSAAGMPPPPDTASESINPVTAQVTSDQTVQGQLGDILKSGNPLLEAAKARAMQTANARGLQNSSMAAQGGEEAMVNAALPIAQADSATSSKQALTNQTISNEFLSMDKGKDIDLEKAYAAFQQNNFQFDKDNALKKYLGDSANSTQLKVAAMQQEAQHAALSERLTELGITDADTIARQIQAQDFTTKQNLLQLKSQDFTNYTNAMNTLLNADLDPADKQNKIDIMNQQYAGVPMPDGWIPSIFNGTPGTVKSTTTDTSPPPTTGGGGNNGNSGGN